MADYSGYTHRNTHHTRKKSQQQQDIPSTVITAQFVVVIILAATIFIVGQVDIAKKERLFESITYNANDYSLFESSFLTKLPYLFFNAAPKGIPTRNKALSNTTLSNNTVLPEYNYLGAEHLGRGGFSPVSALADRNYETQTTPRDVILSPVYLSVQPIAPLNGIISSGFAWRKHPITESMDFHNGIDIAAPEGQIIFSVLPGRVEEIGTSKIYGNYIIINHGYGLKTSYSHCSEIIVWEGAYIRQGERIGKVGQTGMATGPHLHFSVMVDELYVNPLWVLKNYLEEE